MSDSVSYESTGDVAIVRLDDGKANALSPDTLSALNAALDQAEEAGHAVALVGRPDRFSAGFDLGVMREGGPAAARAMVQSGAELALRIARFPAPFVIGSTGHALAMGAVLLAAADTRIGAEGNYKIGYNEVAIGMTTPIFLIEMARARMPNTEFIRSTVQSLIYGPTDAVRAGLYDEVVAPDAVVGRALAEAERLAKLPRRAYVATRAIVRGAALEQIEATLDEDLERNFPGS
ncbi:MAG: crotonase/enoyl-CoA hydratase family protein [bacterium]|nr:crotonase/enoyl-CoA hydratase family protein [bacterium]